jgi:hypothetical protein
MVVMEWLPLGYVHHVQNLCGIGVREWLPFQLQRDSTSSLSLSLSESSSMSGKELRDWLIMFMLSMRSSLFTGQPSAPFFPSLLSSVMAFLGREVETLNCESVKDLGRLVEREVSFDKESFISVLTLLLLLVETVGSPVLSAKMEVMAWFRFSPKRV